MSHPEAKAAPRPQGVSARRGGIAGGYLLGWARAGRWMTREGRRPRRLRQQHGRAALPSRAPSRPRSTPSPCPCARAPSPGCPERSSLFRRDRPRRPFEPRRARKETKLRGGQPELAERDPRLAREQPRLAPHQPPLARVSLQGARQQRGFRRKQPHAGGKAKQRGPRVVTFSGVLRRSPSVFRFWAGKAGFFDGSPQLLEATPRLCGGESRLFQGEAGLLASMAARFTETLRLSSFASRFLTRRVSFFTRVPDQRGRQRSATSVP